MSDLESLTTRQREVYDFIREKIQRRGYGPTVREIGDQFQIASPNGVMCHLKALEKKGIIIREPNMSRAIQLAVNPVEEKGLPYVGNIAAGLLHEAIEQSERFDFDEMFHPKKKDDLVVLRVHGDSMIEAQIAEGDFVVVRRQKTARDGQIVVAETEEGEATLTRFYLQKNRIRLEPANSTMQPIYVKNARILGIVVGVVRKVD